MAVAVVLLATALVIVVGLLPRPARASSPRMDGATYPAAVARTFTSAPRLRRPASPVSRCLAAPAEAGAQNAFARCQKVAAVCRRSSGRISL
ncbi:hypothetical protein [Streptomyces sp. NPDC047886]|uniref:hypothetical protein n=1 Tax=Streptomyces sp. NPDC047886 TaxID=3365490 RepID=UPI003717F4A8